MADKKKSQKVFVTVLFSLAVVSIVFFSILGGSSNLTPLFPLEEPLYDVSCSVSVNNPFLSFTPARIESSPDCSSKRSSWCGVLPFVFGTSGGIHLVVDDKSGVEGFSVGSGLPFGTSRSIKKDVTVKCVGAGSKSVKVRLIDDDKRVLDEKSFELLVGG